MESSIEDHGVVAWHRVLAQRHRKTSCPAATRQADGFFRQ
jgi:hypothetical protein